MQDADNSTGDAWSALIAILSRDVLLAAAAASFTDGTSMFVWCTCVCLQRHSMERETKFSFTTGWQRKTTRRDRGFPRRRQNHFRARMASAAPAAKKNFFGGGRGVQRASSGQPANPASPRPCPCSCPYSASRKEPQLATAATRCPVSPTRCAAAPLSVFHAAATPVWPMQNERHLEEARDPPPAPDCDPCGRTAQRGSVNIRDPGVSDVWRRPLGRISGHTPTNRSIAAAAAGMICNEGAAAHLPAAMIRGA
jgi:hypothetical protein